MGESERDKARWDLETLRNQVPCAITRHMKSIHLVQQFIFWSNSSGLRLICSLLLGTSLLIVHRMLRPVTNTIRPLVDTDSLGCHAAAFSALKHRVLGNITIRKSRKAWPSTWKC